MVKGAVLTDSHLPSTLYYTGSLNPRRPPPALGKETPGSHRRGGRTRGQDDPGPQAALTPQRQLGGPGLAPRGHEKTCEKGLPSRPPPPLPPPQLPPPLPPRLPLLRLQRHPSRPQTTTPTTPTPLPPGPTSEAGCRARADSCCRTASCPACQCCTFDVLVLVVLCQVACNFSCNVDSVPDGVSPMHRSVSASAATRRTTLRQARGTDSKAHWT